jgi:SsrA-binding protein
MSTLALNKRANFDYQILETYEAGLVLTGQEVKSAKNGRVNLKGAYVTLTGTEPFVLNMHIAKYDKAGDIPSYDPYRTRKLLLKKREINHLVGKKQEQGLTLVPLKLYVKRNKVKLLFGLGKGKKKYDKREDIKKRDVKRDLRRRYAV